MAKRSRPNYNPALDGMRALGILSVMLFHLELPGTGAGFLGVDVFFVLSGYLITSHLIAEWLDTGGINHGRFYVRRLLRLLPALLILLVVCLKLGLIPPLDAVITGLGLSNWAIAMNLVPQMNEHPLIHTWSLAAEWQYYLIWPVLLVVALHAGLTRRKLAIGLVVLAIACGVWRGFLWYRTQGFERVMYGLDTRADALLLGSALALALTGTNVVERMRGRRGVRLAAYAAFAVVICLLASGGSFDFFLYGGMTLLVFAAGTLLFAMVVDPPRVLQYVLGNPVIAWIGLISYGLYLWHVPIHQYLLGREGYDLGTPPTALTVFGLSIAIAAASYYLAERPALRLKERLGRKRGPVPISDVVPD